MENALERLAIVASLAMVLIVVLLVPGAAIAARRAGRLHQRGRDRHRRHLVADADGHELQHLGRRRIHLDLRRRHDEWLDSRLRLQRLRAAGKPLEEAIRQGVARQVRPLTMIPLTAIFGMLPAAVATKIGSQTQKPLAIVVVGGMLMTLVMLNLIPVLYSFYGHREPPGGRGGGIGHS